MKRLVRLHCASSAFLAVFAFGLLPSSTQAQTPLIEIQGEAETSPFEGQEVTILAFVTEPFGDTWFMQDAYGPWNGLYVADSTVLVPSNPPWWSEPRQPEVGDFLQLTGTIYEVYGNTQLMDVTEVVMENFWMATPMGSNLTAAATQDEQFEGCRVRLESATVATAPDPFAFWTVEDDTGTVTCLRVDTDDPSMNEDPDGPTPGDEYKIYAALRELPSEYVLEVGDIDTLALTNTVPIHLPASLSPLAPYPNPASSHLNFTLPETGATWEVSDALGRRMLAGFDAGAITLQTSGWARGTYTLRAVSGDSFRAATTFMVISK